MTEGHVKGCFHARLDIVVLRVGMAKRVPYVLYKMGNVFNFLGLLDVIDEINSAAELLGFVHQVAKSDEKFNECRPEKDITRIGWLEYAAGQKLVNSLD